jgi:hypothetical protein
MPLLHPLKAMVIRQHNIMDTAAAVDLNVPFAFIAFFTLLVAILGPH